MTLHDRFDREFPGNTLSAGGLATGGVVGARPLIIGVAHGHVPRNDIPV